MISFILKHQLSMIIRESDYLFSYLLNRKRLFNLFIIIKLPENSKMRGEITIPHFTIIVIFYT